MHIVRRTLCPPEKVSEKVSKNSSPPNPWHVGMTQPANQSHANIAGMLMSRFPPCAAPSIAVDPFRMGLFRVAKRLALKHRFDCHGLIFRPSSVVYVIAWE